MVLEVNTSSTILRGVVDRIITRKLGVNSPLVMLGSNVIYETDDDLEKDMVVQFEKNLDKKLSSFPTPIASGTVNHSGGPAIEFTCSIHVRHRETFNEEEVDGMVLSRLTQELEVEVKPAKEAENSSNITSHDQVSSDLDEYFVMVDPPDNFKRKLEVDERDVLPKKVMVL